MWPVHCLCIYHFFLFTLLLDSKLVCSANTNSNLNEHIRGYSVKEDNNNTINATALQKQREEQYSHFVPIPNPVTFKTVADNELSSSSYSRGLLHHADYGLHDYEETPHQGYRYDYYNHDPINYGHHPVEHHTIPFHPNYGDHHGGYYGGNYGNHHGDNNGGHHIGHHYKHYDHDLAAKTLLWPIAGIALLGAAAALVTNPVLLQLGVVSGRRKRRDTEEVTEADYVDIKQWSHEQNVDKLDENGLDRKILPHYRNKIYTFNRLSKVIIKPKIESVITKKQPFVNNIRIPPENRKYIPIPLKVKPTKKVIISPI